MKIFTFPERLLFPIFKCRTTLRAARNRNEHWLVLNQAAGRLRDKAKRFPNASGMKMAHILVT